jgi:hypothetical protein
MAQVQLLMKSNIQVWVLMYALVFPFVTLGLFESDFSPFYLSVLLIAYLYFAFIQKSTQRQSVTLFIITLFCLVMELVSDPADFRVVKFSVAILTLSALYGVLSNVTGGIFSPRQLLLIVVVWVGSGCISLMMPEAFSFLLFRTGFDSSRGATGLAPEPAYFGLSCVGFFGLCMTGIQECKNDKRARRLMQLAILVSSVGAILSLSLYALIALFLVMFLLRPILGFLALSVSVPLLLLLSPESRLIHLVSETMQNPIFLLSDISFFLRINSIFSAFDIGVLKLMGLGTYFSSGQLFSFSGLAAFYDGIEVLAINSEAIYGGLSIIILRYGFIGVVIAFSIVMVLLSMTDRSKGFRKSYYAGVFSLLPIVIFVGPVALPALFMSFLALTGRIKVLRSEQGNGPMIA